MTKLYMPGRVMAKEAFHAWLSITLAETRVPVRSFFSPWLTTKNSLGSTRSMPTISKGCEKERVISTLRLSSPITIWLDGMTMPK
jgi:hypothetical protein